MKLTQDGRLQEELVASSPAELAQVKVNYCGPNVVTSRTDSLVITRTPLREHRFKGALLDDQNQSESQRQVSLATSSASGLSLVYSTYLGGSADDRGLGIAVEASGIAYVTGWTRYTSDFPTRNPFQASNGGITDVFVTKIDLAGSGLIFSTYLGGGGNDYGAGIAVDTGGNAYVTGGTYSANFPTQNPFQSSSGGLDDAFVTKLNFLPCCVGSTGNVDCDPIEGVDIFDLSRLIDFLYISFAPLCCAEEANTDGDLLAGVDISDLSGLIDYLYIRFTLPAACK